MLGLLDKLPALPVARAEEMRVPSPVRAASRAPGSWFGMRVLSRRGLPEPATKVWMWNRQLGRARGGLEIAWLGEGGVAEAHPTFPQQL